MKDKKTVSYDTPAQREAICRVRTNLLARCGLREGTHPAIGVCLSDPDGDGGAFAVALAASFARLGLRVLLMAEDTASPLPTETPDAGCGTLTVLPREENGEEPVDRLAGPAFAAALAKAKETYDAVFVALPPVPFRAEAAAAAPALDGVVLGVRVAYDRRDAVQAAIASLTGAGATVFGAVAL